jgi:hypothetical protein
MMVILYHQCLLFVELFCCCPNDGHSVDFDFISLFVMVMRIGICIDCIEDHGCFSFLHPTHLNAQLNKLFLDFAKCLLLSKP